MTAPPPALSDRAAARAASAPFAAFAAFGVFWGAWGAALPALRTAAGVGEGQLGTALLFVGLGALPSMALAGRAVDRFGFRMTAWLMVALSVAGLANAALADGMALLVVGMQLVGAASGATDIAINALAGRAEHVSDKPLLTRSHGLFSVGVVVASLGTGALLGRGVSLLGVFAVVTVAMCGLAAVVAMASASLQVRAGECAGQVSAGPEAEIESPSSSTSTRRGGALRGLRQLDPTSPLLVIGLVAALAYATENAHQSWGAVMLTDVFEASPQLAAAAPATFAAAVAVARLSLASLSRTRPTLVLVGGGAVATLGTCLLALAPSVPVALIGLVAAALGTATLFPTLLSRSLRGVDPAQHGRATSRVATTGYLGFLLGPAYVGLLADLTGLRGALLGVAGLAFVFTVVAAPLSGWAARRASRR